MITQEKIERQRVLVSALKTKMQNYDTDPEQWAAQRGYIPTCVYLNRPGAGAWTEGIHFVVLDEHHSFPHTRGGEPPLARFFERIVKFSPHTWG